MQKVILALFLAALPVIAFTQGNEVVQRSSSPSGLRIKENTQAVGNATESLNNSAAAVSDGNNNSSSTSTAQAGSKNAVQIQGNTAIKANARNLNTVSTGRNNAAGNEVGAIGK